MNDGYLLPLHRPAVPTATFVLFPHAGSHANYFSRWRDHLPRDAAVFAVQLPGRMNRSRQPYDEDFSLATRRIADEMEKAVVGDVHLYGHSLGGLLAFVTALQLQRRRSCRVRSLSVSGSAAPTMQRFRNFKSMAEKEVMERILAYGGIPEELLRDRDLLDYFLPTVKADLLLLDDFSRGRDWLGQRLMIPIHAYCGRDDKVAHRELMSDWRHFTNDAFTLEEFAGSHFFVSDMLQEMCKRLVDTAGLGTGRPTGPTPARRASDARALATDAA